MRVEDLKRGSHTEIGPKDFFEIASIWLGRYPSIAGLIGSSGLRKLPGGAFAVFSNMYYNRHELSELSTA